MPTRRKLFEPASIGKGQITGAMDRPVALKLHQQQRIGMREAAE